MKRFILLITVIAIAMCIAFPSGAGEIYMWIDKEGIKHISDTPPPSRKGIKMIDQMSFQKDSPEEIRQYQQEQKHRQIIEENQIERQKRINQYNEQVKKQREKIEEENRERELQRAREDLKSAEKYREELADDRRNAKSQWGTNLYDELKKRQDKIVEEKRHKLLELENK